MCLPVCVSVCLSVCLSVTEDQTQNLMPVKQALYQPSRVSTHEKCLNPMTFVGVGGWQGRTWNYLVMDPNQKKIQE